MDRRRPLISRSPQCGPTVPRSPSLCGRQSWGSATWSRKSPGALVSPREVTQRLKRLPAIVNKLYRHPSMRLAQMQDIGGCRAVLPGGSAEVLGVLRRITQRWSIAAHDDYVANPQPVTGYRAVHAIVERDGRLIEIQLRTIMQQNWAEQVERSQRILGEALKDGKGPEQVLKYYERLSYGLALVETGQPVDPDLVGEVEELRRDLDDRLANAPRG